MSLLSLPPACTGPRRSRGKIAANRPLCSLVILLFLCLALSGSLNLRAAEVLTPRPLELSYTAQVERPTTHVLGIDIVAHQVETAELKFVIPAWAPGRYAIYDFAKNIQDFVSDLRRKGDSLAWRERMYGLDELNELVNHEDYLVVGDRENHRSV